MKKQIIKRGLFGLPVGIAIGFVIPLLISAAVGDGNYYIFSFIPKFSKNYIRYIK